MKKVDDFIIHHPLVSLTGFSAFIGTPIAFINASVVSLIATIGCWISFIISAVFLRNK